MLPQEFRPWILNPVLQSVWIPLLLFDAVAVKSETTFSAFVFLSHESNKTIIACSFVSSDVTKYWRGSLFFDTITVPLYFAMIHQLDSLTINGI